MAVTKKNPELDHYFKEPNDWLKEAKKLRNIILDCGLSEELKWRQPCYSHDDKNIVIIQSFKKYLALMFFKGSLLKDSKQVLHDIGANSRVGRQLRFTSETEVEKLKPVIKSYIKEAIKISEAGLKVAPPSEQLDLPEELLNAFKKDKAFKKAFEGLTPGRQRGYQIHFSSAKQVKTREARIEKCKPQILKGKGLQDR
ncbi:YdeI/OmpD-associated family protein [Pseudobacteriovorax antillogorgiicola]|uniref:Uncharacterized conserved protein YdeI, YjbR/CyaY-like superfamily, DUF1801 family n=1 Tax=Pseudobacteriovorax antillogorgiicola TaxID=1513793 RepID=A0A1Y6CC76_9BACT|nr:DUF1801 domain-containing protein [Pseudobacteriovorax antillogorgiicola]TCS49336.1 uncharacterized protein YdeI (YjbR/CyaY-like superfamily) [Pseudobacteriovorax antillogorgiicola]SMF47948.1 Uncharacterized conserved protein YdeI, YjbR/CyaY-like superfamily, DUF1801 family [Pseudobacteriovorax antillogorgiicola]